MLIPHNSGGFRTIDIPTAFPCLLLWEKGDRFAVDEEFFMLPYNKNNVSFARALRKNMTPEERKLWYNFLKQLPLTVKRQHNIQNFIVDFYVAERKIAIELDGRQHRLPENLREDALRDQSLLSWGITVLRYKNEDVKNNFNAVAEDILAHLRLSPTAIQ